MEKKQKLTLSDIWYYYKWYFVIGLVAVLAIAYTVYNSATQVKSDFLIECVSDIGFNYDAAYTLADSLALSGAVADINGDGKCVADVKTYQTGLSGNQNIDPQMAQVTQLRMAVGESPLIIADKSVFEAYDGYDMFEDVSAFAAENNFNEADVVRSSSGKLIAISIKESKWLKNSNISGEGLYAALRVMNSDNKRNEMLQKQFDAAPDVLRYIIKR